VINGGNRFLIPNSSLSNDNTHDSKLHMCSYSKPTTPFMAKWKVTFVPMPLPTLYYADVLKLYCMVDERRWHQIIVFMQYGWWTSMSTKEDNRWIEPHIFVSPEKTTNRTSTDVDVRDVTGLYKQVGCTYTTVYKIVTSWYLSQRTIMNACVLKQAVDILLSTRLSRHGISVKERLWMHVY